MTSTHGFLAEPVGGQGPQIPVIFGLSLNHGTLRARQQVLSEKNETFRQAEMVLQKQDPDLGASRPVVTQDVEAAPTLASPGCERQRQTQSPEQQDSELRAGYNEVRSP